MSTVTKRPNGPSKVIAIAGGTGGIGSHVVDAILAENKIDVVLLIRKENPERIAEIKKAYPAAASRLHTALVDVTDSKTLEAAFQKYNVDTVISILHDPHAHGFLEKAQDSLITAAEAVPSVRRFSPVEWGSGFERPPGHPLCFHHLQAKFSVIPRLQKSDLNWMGYSIGFCMDYWFSNAPDKVVDGRERKSVGYLHPHKWILDVEARKCEIPIADDGREPEWTFVPVDDIARYVARSALLDNAGWTDGAGRMQGWTGKYSDAVKLAEQATGEKFTVTYKKQSEIKAIIAHPPSPLADFYYNVQNVAIEGGMAWHENPLGDLLESQGLGFKPKSAEELIPFWWGKN